MFTIIWYSSFTGELFFGALCCRTRTRAAWDCWQGAPSQQSYAARVRFPQNIGSFATAPPNLQPSGMVVSKNVFAGAGTHQPWWLGFIANSWWRSQPSSMLWCLLPHGVIIWQRTTKHQRGLRLKFLRKAPIHLGVRSCAWLNVRCIRQLKQCQLLSRHLTGENLPFTCLARSWHCFRCTQRTFSLYAFACCMYLEELLVQWILKFCMSLRTARVSWGWV